jgi:predicted amidohydrolase YtcJ
MYARRLGPDRAAGLNPFAMLARAGVTLAFGSDTPVTPLDPWATVHAAVHHRTPASALPFDAAFAAHTTGGWTAAGERGGTLAVGEPATFAVWRDETCVRTVLDGNTIYETHEVS